MTLTFESNQDRVYCKWFCCFKQITLNNVEDKHTFDYHSYELVTPMVGSLVERERGYYIIAVEGLQR